MCDVPALAFQMGCNGAVDNECQNDENPRHEVVVPAFKIDKYEVTMGDLEGCTTAGACTHHIDDGQCYVWNGSNWVQGVLPWESRESSKPAVCLEWGQANAYCEWAGKKLPTEAQWEKAARGPDSRKYPWGNTGLACDHAVQNTTSCGNNKTAVVGSKPLGVGPYGTLDMIGNVWEWVEDDHHLNYNGAPNDGSAWLDSPRGTYRVLRGGSWETMDSWNLRASTRNLNIPTAAVGHLGFRCAFEDP
ncbi:MAG: formylglycine-generating enzyme family protein [Deltaproteobacteria bacterium]|nr:formylglycine-generating enzyme family protein [Deltaproteobacteria bacterium]